MFVSGDIKKDIVEVEVMLVECCYCIFKLKIGLCLVVDDVVYVLVIKCVLGDVVSVCVDVNQVWSEFDVVNGIVVLQVGGIDLIE